MQPQNNNLSLFLKHLVVVLCFGFFFLNIIVFLLIAVGTDLPHKDRGFSKDT